METLEFSNFAVIHRAVFRKLSNYARERFGVYGANLLRRQTASSPLAQHTRDFLVGDV